MNMTQIAKQVGTSKPTLYKRIKDAGLNVDDLRNAQTNELTQYGIQVITALFENDAVKQKKDTIDDTALLTAQIDAQRREIELLKMVIDAKEAEIKRLVVDLEAWRAKAQEIDMRQLLLTTAAAHKPGMLERVRHIFKK